MTITSIHARRARCSHQRRSDAHRLGRRWGLLFAGASLAAALAGCDAAKKPAVVAEKPSTEIEMAHRAFTRGDLREAETSLQRWLIKNPGDRRSLELLADIESSSGREIDAVGRYLELLRDPPTRHSGIAAKLLPLAIKIGDLYAAIETLEILAELNPNDPQPRQDLSKLLVTAGEWARARTHARWLIRRGIITPYALQLVAAVRAPPLDSAQLANLKKLNPDDVRLDLVLARRNAVADQWATVVTLTEPIVRQHPEILTAQAVYGRALAESGQPAKFDDWLHAVPEGIEQRADYWLAIAAQATANERPAQAVAALSHAVAIDPDDTKALNNFVSALVLCRAEQAAGTVAARQQTLLELRSSVQGFQEWKSLSQRNAIRAAEQLLKLGRSWEAFAWSNAAIRMPADLVADVAARRARVQSGMERTMPWRQPFMTKELVAQFRAASESSAESSPAVAPLRSWVRRQPKLAFESEAESRGLDFWGNTGVPQGESGIMIYQTPGCGIAVTDFDNDGWPDLYSAAAGGTVMQNDSESNRLFRNRDGQFDDVTHASRTTDFGWGQGVGSGDYNEDGFADLVIGNVGRNQLLRNNGDGTFTNVTVDADLDGDEWTTSVAIADFSGDGISDLVTVNYSSGTDWATEKCNFPELNDHRSCAPSMFSAAADRFWIGNGDGTFRPFAPPSVLAAAAGRGLAVSIGALDDRPGNDIFIANDTSANHFWSAAPDAGSPATEPSLVELASLRGVAVGYNGSSQGCMGIGVDDWDHDGDADLFVANFENESNAFYEQIRPGVWADRIDQRGLREISHPLVGFGCEFADFDNDGNAELIVANGNVDDMTFDGSTFRLPTQVFWADQALSWRLLASESLGGYFREDRLGRALVIADFDRDDKIDVAISHLDDELALLMNRTQDSGNSIRFRLIGTGDSRDAVGAKITIHCGGRRQTAFVTAGDGYLCSNENTIRFGIGDSDRAERVDIRWPDGSESLLRDIKAGIEHVAVQALKHE